MGLELNLLKDNFIKNHKELEISLNDGKITKKIQLSNNDIIYINNEYDVVIIGLNDDFSENYLEFDNYLYENDEIDILIDLYENKSIYIPHYNTNQKVHVSFGILKGSINYEMFNYCTIDNDDDGPIGAPILDFENKKIIGIYRPRNYSENKANGIFLISVLKDIIRKYLKVNIEQNPNKNMLLKKLSSEYLSDNQIKLILKIDEDMLEQEVYFLDNYIPNSAQNDENLLPHNHLKELNEKNVEIEINNEKFKYCKSFSPKKVYNQIIIKFKTPVIDCGFMFFGCNNIIDIDFSLFNTTKVTNMENMFSFCDNLKKVDLSKFDLTKVNNMNQMFYLCFNLEIIQFNYLGVDDEENTNINEIFTGCGKLECLDLSLSSKDEILKIDFQWIKGIMKNLKKIKVKKEFKNTFEINDFIMEYV